MYLKLSTKPSQKITKEDIDNLFQVEKDSVEQP